MPLKLFVGITDRDWYELLRQLPELDEVNFWAPGGTAFKALSPGELFLFKLHAPDHYIVGGGIFAYSNSLPCSLAWETFGQANGAQHRRRDEGEDRQATPRRPRLARGLRDRLPHPDPAILPRAGRLDPRAIMGAADRSGEDLLDRGRRTAALCGSRLPPACSPAWSSPKWSASARLCWFDRASARAPSGSWSPTPTIDGAPSRRSGPFRRSTRRMSAPMPKAACTRSRNGLLLRRDIHSLFDRGYVTVTPELRFEVSRRIKEEFENGRDYYALHGRSGPAAG